MTLAVQYDERARAPYPAPPAPTARLRGSAAQRAAGPGGAGTFSGADAPLLPAPSFSTFLLSVADPAGQAVVEPGPLAFAVEALEPRRAHARRDRRRSGRRVADVRATADRGLRDERDRRRPRGAVAADPAAGAAGAAAAARPGRERDRRGRETAVAGGRALDLLGHLRPRARSPGRAAAAGRVQPARAAAARAARGRQRPRRRAVALGRGLGPAARAAELVRRRSRARPRAGRGARQRRRLARRAARPGRRRVGRSLGRRRRGRRGGRHDRRRPLRLPRAGRLGRRAGSGCWTRSS